MSHTALRTSLILWFRDNARDLAWRGPGTSAWGILLSEVMSQQTPVSRVEPLWLEWMERWPTPADLASAGTDEVLRAWGRLGYPRRALRLRECAAAIVDKHGGTVPDDVEQLLDLPGIGDYTARAVAAFAYGQAVPVVDTNVRRVYHRAVTGRFLAGPARRRELDDVASLLPSPTDDGTGGAAEFSAAMMELGALLCTASTPACDLCPIMSLCRWRELGCPSPTEEELAAARKRVQKFTGTDRQVRGLIMALLRNAEAPVGQPEITAVWPDAAQRSRALFSLLNDGLAEQDAHGYFHLPR
jgi:A/G-specific DNA glycosylase